MPILAIIILGVVQGLAELLPVSSSAHFIVAGLVAPAWLSRWLEQGRWYILGSIGFRLFDHGLALAAARSQQRRLVDLILLGQS
jgi:hypothetical protein